MLYLRGVVCSQIVGERLRVTPTSHVGTNDSEKVFCTIARISKRKFEQKKYGQFNTKKHMSYQLPKKECCILTLRINERASSIPPARTSFTPTSTRDVSKARSPAAPFLPPPVAPPVSDLLPRPLPPTEEREGETEAKDDEVKPAIASLADKAHLLGDSDEPAASLPRTLPPPPPLEGQGTDEETRSRSRVVAPDAAVVPSSSLLAPPSPQGSTSATQI